jgi:beta-glucosidase
VDAQGARAVQPGHYVLSIGGAQPSDSRAPNTVQTAKFTIEGTKVLPR